MQKHVSQYAADNRLRHDVKRINVLSRCDLWSACYHFISFFISSSLVHLVKLNPCRHFSMSPSLCMAFDLIAIVHLFHVSKTMAFCLEETDPYSCVIKLLNHIEQNGYKKFCMFCW